MAMMVGNFVKGIIYQLEALLINFLIAINNHLDTVSSNFQELINDYLKSNEVDVLNYNLVELNKHLWALVGMVWVVLNYIEVSTVISYQPYGEIHVLVLIIFWKNRNYVNDSKRVMDVMVSVNYSKIAV